MTTEEHRPDHYVPAEWIHVARSKHAHLQRILDRDNPADDVAVRIHESSLARTVPHLCDAYDGIARQLKQAKVLEQGAHRHALQAEADRDETEATLKRREAWLAQIEAARSRDRLALFDVKGNLEHAIEQVASEPDPDDFDRGYGEALDYACRLLDGVTGEGAGLAYADVETLALHCKTYADGSAWEAAVRVMQVLAKAATSESPSPGKAQIKLATEARPAPVGSWWRTGDGSVLQVSGDYRDGPGDQIVTYTLYRQGGDAQQGKWGGKELADAYARIEPHEVPEWVEVAR